MAATTCGTTIDKVVMDNEFFITAFAHATPECAFAADAGKGMSRQFAECLTFKLGSVRGH